jgi:hypothetical protein
MKTWSLKFEVENKNYIRAYLTNENITADFVISDKLTVTFADIESAFKTRIALDYLLVE